MFGLNLSFILMKLWDVNTGLFSNFCGYASTEVKTLMGSYIPYNTLCNYLSMPNLSQIMSITEASDHPMKLYNASHAPRLPRIQLINASYSIFFRMNYFNHYQLQC